MGNVPYGMGRRPCHCSRCAHCDEFCHNLATESLDFSRNPRNFFEQVNLRFLQGIHRPFVQDIGLPCSSVQIFSLRMRRSLSLRFSHLVQTDCLTQTVSSMLLEA